ncbi:hypothetical protein F7P69_17215 [Cellulosimicrobium funkei]|nr:hypothetical protein [Cellulosimicrobium funkei]
MTADQWAPWVIGILGGVTFISGILAYQGRYKSWLVLKSFLAPGWAGLASLYLGMGLLLIGAGGFAASTDLPDVIVVVCGALGFPSLVLGIIGFFWLPRFLWPRWLKDTQQEMDRGEDKLSQAMKPGGALYGRLGRPPGQAPHPPSPPPDHEGNRP